MAVVAILWMAFTTTVFFFPATPKTTPQEMNYTIVVLGGVLILALVYYYFPVYGGVYWFTGPHRRIGGLPEASVSSTEDKKGSMGSTEKIGVDADVTAAEQ